MWRVAGWLQRGRARAREALFTHAARALALLVVVARDRLAGERPLSLRAGLHAAALGLHRYLLATELCELIAQAASAHSASEQRSVNATSIYLHSFVSSYCDVTLQLYSIVSSVYLCAGC